MCFGNTNIGITYVHTDGPNWTANSNTQNSRYVKNSLTFPNCVIAATNRKANACNTNPKMHTFLGFNVRNAQIVAPTPGMEMDTKMKEKTSNWNKEVSLITDATMLGMKISTPYIATSNSNHAPAAPKRSFHCDCAAT